MHKRAPKLSKKVRLVKASVKPDNSKDLPAGMEPPQEESAERMSHVYEVKKTDDFLEGAALSQKSDEDI